LEVVKNVKKKAGDTIHQLEQKNSLLVAELKAVKEEMKEKEQEHR
jgi:hypothetical protein